MKLPKLLWTIASFYLIVVGFFYIIVLKDTPAEGQLRYEFIQEHWNIFDYQWKAEFLIAALLAMSSFIFGSHTKNPGFQIIGVGQLIVAMAFPVSIGITPNASWELGALIGKAGHQSVNFGMLISMAGFFSLHWRARIMKNWLRTSALILAALSFISFGAGFINIIDPMVAQKAMILVILLYLINGYFGLKINETNVNKV